MDNLIKSLVEILGTEYKYYLELNDLAIQKKEAIIANDVEKLTELLKDDEEVIEYINELENKRTIIMKELINLNNFQESNLNFNKIIDISPDQYSGTLKRIRESLVQTIDQLHDQNEQNSLLIQEAMKLNQFSLSMMMNFLEPESQTYNPKQANINKDNNRVTRLLDRRG